MDNSGIKLSSILFSGLALCLFVPKINIINIPFTAQGIRYDDILIMLGIIIVVLKSNLNLNYFPLRISYFFFYGILVLTALISANLYGVTPIILVLKWIEYSLYFVLLHYAAINFRRLHFVSFSFLILNFILVLLQKSKIIGCIYTAGYKEYCSDRPAGISGGAWELPLMLLFIVLPVIYDPYIKIRIKLSLLVITSITIMLVESRSGIIILVATIIFALISIKYLRKYLLIIILIPLIIAVINHNRMGFIKSSNLDVECTGKTCNYHEEIFYFDAIPYLNHNPELTKYIPLTMIARLGQWDSVLINMKNIDYIIGKGLGYSGIFKEGMYIKILSDLGIIGLFVFGIYYYNLLKNYKILALILGLGCLTIDALSASKIMLSFYFSLFYFKNLYIDKKKFIIISKISDINVK